MVQHDKSDDLILTASLTTGAALVKRGIGQASSLIDEIVTLDHDAWETILYVGDVEFHRTMKGPFPDQQMRVSVRPSASYAALNHADINEESMPVANSYNPTVPIPNIYLIFNGGTGAVFPRTAAMPIDNVRDALHEWLRTRRRPTCIEWRPSDIYYGGNPMARNIPGFL